MYLGRIFTGFVIGDYEEMIVPGVIDYVECEVILITPGTVYRGKKLDSTDCQEYNAGQNTIGYYECMVPVNKDSLSHIKYIGKSVVNCLSLCGVGYNLAPKEDEILRLIGIRTEAEIATEFGLAQSSISRIKKRALKKLQSPFISLHEPGMWLCMECQFLYWKLKRNR